ncbi:MAG: hypothetical protein ABSB41_01225 [Anaerolineales bacterium]|jgi:hypothetical protein
MIVVLNVFTVLLTILTTTGLLLYRDWRYSLGFLAAQYLVVFWLCQAHWPISMAAVKLVTGWMACAALGITQLSISRPTDAEETSWPQGRLFRLFSAGLILVVTYALANSASSWLGLSLPAAWASLILIGMGLLHLGITAQPFRVILGLLTVLSGFEILYAAVEGSVLVAALLAAVNLGLALIGAYFLYANPLEETR